jgi:hypothetical protein
MAEGPTRPNRIPRRLPECKRALQKRAIETENSMLRFLICFIVAVVMLLSPLVQLEAAAPHKHCWWHHHHHFCHT